MQNTRIYYATEAVGIAPFSSPTSYKAINGVQTVGMNGRIAIEYIHELGNLPTYNAYEDIPEVEVTIEKVLDGYSPVYLSATEGATSADIAGRSNQRCNVALSVHRDNLSRASGNQVSQAICSGMYPQNLTYNFTTQGAFRETVTMTGNVSVWVTGSFTFQGMTAGMGVTSFTPAAPEGVNRRQHLNMTDSRFPTEIPGISTSGTNDPVTVGDITSFGASFDTIQVSCNLGRTGRRELGRKAYYARYVEYPVDVTSTFTFAGKDGDLFSLHGEDTDDTTDQTILLKTTEGLVLDLGSKNRLTSKNHTGAGAGQRGSDVVLEFTYGNQNDLIVQHPADPTVALRPS